MKDEPPETGHVWGARIHRCLPCAADFDGAGRVYRIPANIADTIWPYLDHREKDGYTLRTVDVWGIKDGQEVIIEKDVSAAI